MTIETSFILPDARATRAFGRALGARLISGDVVALQGPLGAGKTALARAAIEASTGVSDAPSPTFAIVETYEAHAFTLYHFDLYRLESIADAVEAGLEEALEGGVCLIEWPERAAALLPPDGLLVGLSIEGEARHAFCRASENWRARLEEISSAMTAA